MEKENIEREKNKLYSGPGPQDRGFMGSFMSFVSSYSSAYEEEDDISSDEEKFLKSLLQIQLV